MTTAGLLMKAVTIGPSAEEAGGVEEGMVKGQVTVEGWASAEVHSVDVAIEGRTVVEGWVSA